MPRAQTQTHPRRRGVDSNVPVRDHLIGMPRRQALNSMTGPISLLIPAAWGRRGRAPLPMERHDRITAAGRCDGTINTPRTTLCIGTCWLGHAAGTEGGRGEKEREKRQTLPQANCGVCSGIRGERSADKRRHGKQEWISLGVSLDTHTHTQTHTTTLAGLKPTA